MQIPEFPVPGHDHAACVDQSMARARDTFATRGERLTKLREAVLRTLAGSHAALGAYDIIERTCANGRRVAPISVYRVLETLLDAGLVHRIESRNAFVACHTSHRGDGPVMFLVCETCGMVADQDRALAQSLKKSAAAAGFSTSGAVLELSGLCRHCSG